jgi:glucan-binding YG repeat protein
MDIKEKIKQIIRIKGPVLPVQISKEINANILMASAHLSELADKKQLKISKLKVGGSPLYYLPGQESGLQKFSDNLHEKEKKAYNLLSQKKVLMDKDLEPAIRVALREIKDFAVPLQVNYKGDKEVFWKWYLAPNSEVEQIIKSKLSIKESVKKTEEKKDIKEEQKEKIEEKTEPREHIQRKIKKDKEDLFLSQITNYFEKNKINVIGKEIIRKNSEIDFLITLPSAVGILQYYCKAKNKKRINDGDLSSAFVQGQIKKLPVLFLTNGDLTKRAKEMLDKEFKNIAIKKLIN